MTISELRAYLGLLRSFRELGNPVTNLEANRDMRNKVPPLARELEPQQTQVVLVLGACVREVHAPQPFRLYGSPSGFPPPDRTGDARL